MEGNIFGKFSCECMTTLHKHRKGFLLENQAHRGIYPTIYDLACFQRLLRITKAVIFRGSMCAWGLKPSDDLDPAAYCRKDYWLAVSANLAPFLMTLDRPLSWSEPCAPPRAPDGKRGGMGS